MKINASTSNDTRPVQDGLARAQQGSTNAATDSATTPAAQSPASTTGGGTTGDSANVSLSSVSSSLRSVAASDSSDIDTAKVESIKNAISNGTLQIDTGKIADGVLDMARSLIQPSSGT